MKKTIKLLKCIPSALLLVIHTALYSYFSESRLIAIYVFSALALAFLCFAEKVRFLLPFFLFSCFVFDFSARTFSFAAVFFAVFAFICFTILVILNYVPKNKEIAGFNRFWALPAILYTSSKILFHIDPARKYAEHFSYLEYFPAEHIFSDSIFIGFIADALFAIAFFAICHAIKINENLLN